MEAFLVDGDVEDFVDTLRLAAEHIKRKFGRQSDTDGEDAKSAGTADKVCVCVCVCVCVFVCVSVTAMS
jgi:hypothetical protein